MNVMTLNGMTAFSLAGSAPLNSAEELEAALRHIGATRYHNLHPFHRLLHGGKLNKGQVQAWALNRYFYQSTIPIKDAVVISRFRDRGIRMEWRHRIEDHDGDLGAEGGIERWLKLTEGLGLDIGRRVFLHINNSNPALLSGSDERKAVEQAGWQIPADGTEITL